MTRQLTPFEQAYLERALLSTLIGSDDDDLTSDYSVADFGPSAIASAHFDFCRFIGAVAMSTPDCFSHVVANLVDSGADFWATRNRYHGAGFDHRGLGELGTKLTDIARAFAPVGRPYVGDDGFLYFA